MRRTPKSTPNPDTNLVGVTVVTPTNPHGTNMTHDSTPCYCQLCRYEEEDYQADQEAEARRWGDPFYDEEEFDRKEEHDNFLAQQDWTLADLMPDWMDEVADRLERC